MFSYIVRRLLLFVPTLLAVWILLFLIIRTIGDPALAKLGQHANPKKARIWKEKYGLNRPRFLDNKALALGLVGVFKTTRADQRVMARYETDQLPKWYDPGSPKSSLFKKAFDTQLITSLGAALRFEFGNSVSTNQPVSEMIKRGIGPSLSVTVPMFLLGLIVSVYLSMFCALYRARFVDHSVTFACIVLMSLSMPAVILLLQHSVSWIEWFPVSGYMFGWRAVGFVALPVMIGCLLGLGQNTRFYRSVMIEEVRKDYVRTARAKGLQQGVILFKHVLKNAMIPIVTRVVIAIPFLYAGSFLLETFFGIPGLGRMTYDALQAADFKVLEAITFIGALLFMIANLMCDILYVFLDPRVRLK